ncbi:cysteine proteinase [Neocallimastix lanati (nom. inval.)]|jgi:U4/U6.U5 tri-snRNP-associated protein 2|uniref:U4/U6.U5 tri-snRNP-associated protein 2-like protein n=1 Tax=Neocallimastix californiae TaxID=1754190 RepID=A0A1Y2A6T3_9FUNG|nr:cysteine proteinase [Neocallimastix sp. JGI-2020a]ORY17745.1 u4/U6.U5 tri-snRNP-associated protein 2-like protein [Neocallimastix californiae]|eukprot:ORY17745.1 u4/U6.U5 tri-snRNP-associated protein 2-like protein [Neocallimastix californiae]
MQKSLKRKRDENDELRPGGLYLDTIRRTYLDFDFEKVCSVSLSNLNVYACLVCGKYYQGRGTTSHAYIHSLHDDHHVFINLHTLKVYILPDGYEVNDSSLDDIKYVIKPTFTLEQINQLDKNDNYSYDLNNKKYLPGFIGLNNIKKNDYINVIIQALIHITPLRNFFLRNDKEFKSELVNRFGMLMRKMWNPKAFKAQVSPHELLQEISNASKKKFLLTEQNDPVEFLYWFLNTLHFALGGTRKKSSIIQKTFQGKLQIESQTILSEPEEGKEKFQKQSFQSDREITKVISPFMVLVLDLPPPPLFQDEMEQNIIPQVSLSTLLSRYDGKTIQEVGNTLKRYKLLKLPNYLIFNAKRFNKNNWSHEKNPTIVNFPIKNVDMKEYLEVDPNDKEEYKYDLVANICHEGKDSPKNGSYKVHVYCKGKDQWFQIQDLIVEEIMPQMIFLSETYIQIWERKFPSKEQSETKK